MEEKEGLQEEEGAHGKGPAWRGSEGRRGFRGEASALGRLLEGVGRHEFTAGSVGRSREGNKVRTG